MINAGLNRRLWIFGALIVSLFALATSVATAQAGWSSAETISGSGPSAEGASISGLPNGETVATWLQPSGGGTGVFASRIDADGNSGPAVLLSTSGQDADDPVVAVAPSGDATVAWVRTDGTDFIQSNTFSAAGVAGTVVDRSIADHDAEAPEIVAADNGSVGMVWRKFDGSLWTIQSLVVPATGVPGAIQTFSPLSLDSGLPDIALKASDNTFELAWPVGSTGNENIAFVALDASGTPGEQGFVSISCTKANPTDPYTCVPKNMDKDVDSVSVGVNSAGVVMVVWRQYVDRAVHTTDPTTDPPPDFHLSGVSSQLIKNTSTNAASQPQTQALVGATPVFISPKSEEVSQLQFAQGAGVTAAVVWKTDVPGSSWIRTAKVGNPATYWSVSPRLSDDVGAYGSPQLSLGTDGGRAVAWTQESAVPGVPEMQVMRLTPDGLFVGPASLAAPGAMSSSHPVPYMAASGVSTVAFDMKDSGSTDVAAFSRFTDPGITTSPGNLLMGNNLVNVQGAARYISIVNPGTTTNKVTGISLSGPDSGQFTVDATSCVKDLVPNAVCMVSVFFRPTSSGSKTASVQINSLAGNKVVSLQGNGVLRTTVGLKVKPATQSLKKGKSVKVPVKITNSGGIAANNLKLCQQGSKKVVRPKKKCLTVGSLAVGATKSLSFRIKLNGKAKSGKKYPVSYRLTVGNASSRIKYIKFALKGKKK